jgi:hypothetical protein
MLMIDRPKTRQPNPLRQKNVHLSPDLTQEEDEELQRREKYRKQYNLTDEEIDDIEFDAEMLGLAEMRGKVPMARYPAQSIDEWLHSFEGFLSEEEGKAAVEFIYQLRGKIA